ncbi:MAG: AAA family ATPase [Desulfobulbaceae bacterium]|nr:AAA family ATPase [Desulfobulbaceae bacterium]
MYEKFFGLTEKPFQLVPNPRFLYRSLKHQNALTYLEYGLSEGAGFILLTGDIGSGKTTLVRYFLNRIEKDIEVGVIFNTNINAGELIDLVLHEFEVAPGPAGKASSLDLLHRYLIDRYARGKRVLLIIDEAQNLSDHALEEVRMLSNLQTDDHLLLQVMLVGQPELKRKLLSPSLAQLAQRISVQYHLSSLDGDDTARYIAHRLQQVGGAPDLFDDEAVALIYQASGGVPRTINLLCDSALVYGYADGLHRIGGEVVEQVLNDKGGLGLAAAGPEAVPALDPGGSTVAVDAALRQRLLAVEEKVQKLQLQVEWQLEESARSAARLSDRVVSELSTLLQQERQRADRILGEYAKLKKQLEAPAVSPAREGGEERPRKPEAAAAGEARRPSPREEPPPAAGGKDNSGTRGGRRWWGRFL